MSQVGEVAGPRTVVLFGTYDAVLHPRVATMREGLAASCELSELNQPLGLSTADKIDAASSARGALRLGVAIARAWWPLWRRARRARLDPDLVVVGYLGHFDVHLARLLWPRTPIALDHLVGLADTVRDRGLGGGLKLRLLDALDRAALHRADLVIVDTAEQLEQLPDPARDRAVVVPVGATHEWAEQVGPAAPPPVQVCFVGLYTPLHGAPVIGEAIARLADDDRLSFTMIGDGQERAASEAAAGGSARVRWLDWVEGAELPALVASHHVTLGIFGTTPKARRVVPTKVYQGLAAGTLVITSDTAPQRRALGDAARFVPAGDAGALADELRAVADDLLSGRTAPRRDAGARFTGRGVVAPLLAAPAERPQWRTRLRRSRH
jgi:glycosyltransferase involved in cell wall biosynthesis